MLSGSITESHRGPKPGCELVALFGSNSDDGVSAVIGANTQRSQIRVQVGNAFGSYFYDGLNVAIGVQHTEVPNHVFNRSLNAKK